MEPARVPIPQVATATLTSVKETSNDFGVDRYDRKEQALLERYDHGRQVDGQKNPAVQTISPLREAPSAKGRLVSYRNGAAGICRPVIESTSE